MSWRCRSPQVGGDNHSSVIPACVCGGSTGLATGETDWTPDPFNVAQGRGEHSRTTIKAFEGDTVLEKLLRRYLIRRKLLWLFYLSGAMPFF